MKNNKGHSTVSAVLLMTISMILGLLAAIGFVSTIIFLADKSIQRAEEVECVKWSEEADQYPSFYQAKWQVEQCNRYNITINAPIK